MGTNYYLVPSEELIKKLSHSKEMETILKRNFRFHIGKCSGGWKFLFEESEDFSSFKDYKNFIEKEKDTCVIKNEYDEEVSPEEFFEIVEKKQGEKSHNIPEFAGCGYYQDDEGYDFMEGEFS